MRTTGKGASKTSRFPGRSPCNPRTRRRSARLGLGSGPHRAPHGLHAEYEGTCEAKLRQSGGERYSRFLLENVDPVWCKGLAGHDTTASACCSVSSPRAGGSRSDEDSYLPQVPRCRASLSFDLVLLPAQTVAVPVRAAPWDLAWYRGGQGSQRRPDTPLPPPIHTPHAPPFHSHSHTSCTLHSPLARLTPRDRSLTPFPRSIPHTGNSAPLPLGILAIKGLPWPVHAPAPPPSLTRAVSVLPT